MAALRRISFPPVANLSEHFSRIRTQKTGDLTPAANISRGVDMTDVAVGGANGVAGRVADTAQMRIAGKRRFARLVSGGNAIARLRPLVLRRNMTERAVLGLDLIAIGTRASPQHGVHPSFWCSWPTEASGGGSRRRRSRMAA